MSEECPAGQAECAALCRDHHTSAHRNMENAVGVREAVAFGLEKKAAGRLCEQGDLGAKFPECVATSRVDGSP